MKEKDVLIEKIKRIIDAHQNRRVILYGTGNVTRWVVDGFRENEKYTVDEIMDFNCTEETFLGFHIISRNDVNRVLPNDLIIVMNRNPVIAQFIYNRIWRFLPEDTLVLSIEGNEFERSEQNEDACVEPKTLSFEDAKRKINNADRVSFDIFDTLLIRSIEKPTDVFSLMTEHVKKVYGLENFPELRREAEICANKLYRSATINEIYEKLCELSGIGDMTIAQELVQEEIDTECTVLSLRQMNVELLKYCIAANKEVYLISDTYYDIATFIHFFRLNGFDLESVICKDNILLSCELRKSKENGEMWSYFAGISDGSKCLHIGDNIITDIELSKKVGVDSICTYSPSELRHCLTPSVIYEKANALTSIELGLLDSFVFNSPFSNGKEIYTHFDYGYMILGPVIFNYLYWILRKETRARDTLMNRNVYFFSRDGYFLVDLFNQLSDALNKKICGVYLYTSRAFLKYISYAQGKGEKAGFIGSLKDYLKYRFNLDVSTKNVAGKFVDADDNVDEIIAPYIDEIMRNQAKSRGLYDAYLNRMGIERGDEDIAIADPTYNGTCQYYLSKYANIKTKGYYCVANLSDENKYLSDDCRLQGFYQKPEDKKAKNSLINKYTLVFESSIMVSPEGSMLDIDENGIVFTPKSKTQELFGLKEETYKGISRYFKEMCDMILRFGLWEEEPDSILPQMIFAMCIEGKIKVSDKIKNSLYADDYYNQITDYNVAWQ